MTPRGHRRSTFVTWYPYCRRSDTIAAALGGSSHLIHSLGFKRPLQAPLKYILQTRKTLRVLREERPSALLVAVPPIFAALPVARWARRNGARLVIDAHTGIFDHGRWRWFLPLTRRVFRAADAVIVTSEFLADRVREWGGTPLVIGDVPVEFGPGIAPETVDRPRVVVINTFSVDEPVDEILDAARRLPDIAFAMTGDVKAMRRRWRAAKPDNLTYTGFVSEAEYAGLLRSADAIVVLTTHDHTMQRGGYEAMALGKPLVTSDWSILRETFSRGTVHTANDGAAIAASVRQTLRQTDRLGVEMRALRDERRGRFESRLRDLAETLGVRLAGTERAAPPLAAVRSAR